MHRAAMGLARLDQPIAIAPVVLVAIEDRRAFVAPLEDMQRQVGQDMKAEPSH